MIFLEVNDQKEKLKLNRLQKTLLTKSMLNNIGSMARSFIDSRTLAGKDYSGNSFVPYSRRWASFRKATGHSTSPVNLFFSGRMLASIQHEVNPGKGLVRIFFADKEAGLRAHGLHFGYRRRKLPSRKFFELSKDEIRKIETGLKQDIEKQIEEIQRG